MDMPNHPEETESAGSRKLVLGISLFLVALVWAVFGQTLTHDFVNYDDQGYVFENAEVTSGLTIHGILWAFTQTHSFNWHPLTWISHMLDCQFFGLHAGGHHFTSVLLHSIAAVLLFLVSRRMTGALWRSAFVAAIFAIHPLHVESVAWVAERKDVLSGVFFLLTLGAYTRYVRHPSTRRYLLVAFFFVLGLMSKPMLVTLPLVLLILDYWPLERVSHSSSNKSKAKQTYLLAAWTPLIREKIPLFALSIASCLITVVAQKSAIAPVDQLPLLRRLCNAALSVGIYLWQMIFPVRLAPLYLYPTKLRLGEAVFAALLIALTSLVAFISRRRRPYLLAGWLWYLVMLLPVLGILQVGWQAHADRYTYLPQIGLYFALAWFIRELTVSWRHRHAVLGARGGVIIVLFAAMAWKQTTYWSNTESLWRHAIEVTPRNYVAFTNLGDALLQQGRFDEAMAKYEVSLGLSPNHADAENGLASALARQGQYEQAIDHFKKAIASRPQDPEYHNNFGNTLCQEGLLDEGIREYEKALQLRPDRVEIHNAETQFNLANALLRKGQIDDAIAHYHESLQIQPNDVDTHTSLATALMRKGMPAEAIREFQIALEISPQSVNALNYLSWALATCSDDSLRKGDSAIALAEQAKNLTNGRDPLVLRTLAAAYAETGNYSKAIEVARTGLTLAREQKNPRLTATIQKELALYQAGSPYHERQR
jgi:tetratricopeptide (TPR) repeat protein